MITVFGSINMDLIASVAHLPQPGETVRGSGFQTAPGGKGANQALAAARMGAPVRLLGAVGEDMFAEDALALLGAEGVALDAIKTVPGPTGTAMILVEGSGENVIAVIPGANGALAAESYAGIRFAPGDVLLLQVEIPVEAMAPVIARARADGAEVLLNLAPYDEAAHRLLPEIDILIVNEGEAHAAAKALGVSAASETVDNHRAVALALARSLGVTVIMTLGAEGVVAVTARGTETRTNALPIAPVDTVGAGDTFCGALAAALDGGSPLSLEALTLAAAAGSLACLKEGAQPAIPRRAAVVEALTTRQMPQDAQE